MSDSVILDLINIGVTGILVVLLIRGDLVPKSTNDREIKRGDSATETAAKTSESLRAVTDTLRGMGDEIKGLNVALTEQRKETNNLREVFIREVQQLRELLLGSRS